MKIQFSVSHLCYVLSISILFSLFQSNDLEAVRTFGKFDNVKVCRVHDGDTFIADIDGVHPIIGSEISIRIAKIDTPEITDTRNEIKQLAIQARDYVSAKLAHAKIIQLDNIKRDKYFRILADVFVDGESLAEELIAQGLAKPYNGKKKPEWP